MTFLSQQSWKVVSFEIDIDSTFNLRAECRSTSYQRTEVYLLCHSSEVAVSCLMLACRQLLARHTVYLQNISRAAYQSESGHSCSSREVSPTADRDVRLSLCLQQRFAVDRLNILHCQGCYIDLWLQVNSFGFSPDDLGLESLDQGQATAPRALTQSSAAEASGTAAVADPSPRHNAASKPTLTHLDDKGMAHMVDVGQVSSPSLCTETAQPAI